MNVNINVCAYNSYGIRIAVIYPHDGSWCIANHHRNGYPLHYATVEAAKTRVEMTQYPNIAEWREEVI